MSVHVPPPVGAGAADALGKANKLMGVMGGGGMPGGMGAPPPREEEEEVEDF